MGRGGLILLMAMTSCSSRPLAPSGAGAGAGSGGHELVTPSETCPPPPTYAPFGCAPTYSQQRGNVCLVLGVNSFEGSAVCGGWIWTCSTTQTCLYDAQQRLIYAKWCDDIVPGYVCVHSGCSCDISGECLESANLDPTVGVCASSDAAIDATMDGARDAVVHLDASPDVAMDRPGDASFDVSRADAAD